VTVTFLRRALIHELAYEGFVYNEIQIIVQRKREAVLFCRLASKNEISLEVLFQERTLPGK
jgi:hypothetical protein